jgi:DnaK suppressor protein
MNVERFRKLLRAKERDLLSEIAELKDESRRPDGPDVGDAADRATEETATNDSVAEASVLTQTLSEVRLALRRIEEGTYGKCAVCGRPIELARLEAIPWTAFCIQHEIQREDQPADKANSA